MRKILMTAIGSAVIGLSIGQVASAHEPHHARKAPHHAKIFTDQNARDANALYRPELQSAYGSAERYSGGFSAPAGR